LSLKELNLERSYDSDNDNILDDFYIPILSNASKYKRLAGFFTSSSLSVASRGIANLIENNGDMKLVVGAELTKEDENAIKKAYKEKEEVVEERINQEIENIKGEDTEV